MTSTNVSSGVTGTEEYRRTVGALFAVYWLARIGVDGERGFSMGVDDEYTLRDRNLIGPSPRPLPLPSVLAAAATRTRTATGTATRTATTTGTGLRSPISALLVPPPVVDLS